MTGRGDLMLLGRTTAGLALLGRSGARAAEVAYDDDGPTVKWRATATWQGTKVWSEDFPYPAHAVEDLLSRVLNGGQCTRCERTTVVGVVAEGFCCFVVTAANLDNPESYRYTRTCEVGGRR